MHPKVLDLENSAAFKDSKIKDIKSTKKNLETEIKRLHDKNAIIDMIQNIRNLEHTNDRLKNQC